MHISRLPTNPIIHRGLFAAGDPDGENINGPCLVRVPDWVPNPLGRYYCYFAHHKGETIRLAYADALAGPWRLHPGGVIALADIPAARGHIASPEVVWDHSNHECRLYLHGFAHAAPKQHTFLVCGDNGLHFPRVGSTILCPSYLRVWRHQDWWYGMVKGGRLYRSQDGRSVFTAGPIPHIVPSQFSATGTIYGMRHLALVASAESVMIYWSNIGDAPERILRVRLATTGDWTTWQAGEIEEVLYPEMPWEGAELAVVTSVRGAVHHPEHAVRDPHVFTDTDDRQWLTYSTAGEQAIALAELHETSR